MYVFIDESGDLGFDVSRAGTSSHFVVTAVTCQANRYRQIDKAVRRTLKNKLRGGSNKNPVQEIKGAKTSISVKRYLWKQLSAADFDVFCVVLDKRDSKFESVLSVDALYDLLVEYLLDQIAIEIARPHLHVEIDGSKGKRGRERFNARLNQRIHERVPAHIPSKIHHMKSEQSSGIQLADVFGWGLLRRHRDNDAVWYDEFSDRILAERTVKLNDLG